MRQNRDYPYYHFYDSKRTPTVLSQEFPLPTFSETEIYYPPNHKLLPYFSTIKEAQKFGAAQFCGFLGDTIEVEHCLVIPAIVALRRLPYSIPTKPKQDLYKTATDEGFHAEQALAYLAELENLFELTPKLGPPPPLFLRRLEEQRARQTKPLYRELVTVLNGIVTETRISVELSKFAHNEQLSETVKAICKSHAQDEAIHSAQFQALGKWLWQDFDERTKEVASGLLLQSTIARSLPDLDNVISSLTISTGRSLRDASRIILKEYNEENLISDMMIAAKPTLLYLHQLKITDFGSFESLLDAERKKIRLEIDNRLKKL